MKDKRSSLAWAVACCALTALGLAGPGQAVAAPTAPAAVITVTTTADVVDAGDGLTSLREAFSTAGTNGADDTIALGAGLTYPLTRCGPGPLTHADGHGLVVQGNSSVVEQMCDAKGIIASTNKAGRLELQNLIIDGGPNSTAAVLEGAAVRSDSELMLKGVEIRNVLAPRGSVVWSGPGHGVTPYRLTLSGANLHHNTGAAVSCDNCSLLLDDSTVSDTTGSGLVLTNSYPVLIQRSTIARNTRAGLSNTGQGLPTNELTVDEAHIFDNGRVGIRCQRRGRFLMYSSAVAGNGLTAKDALGGISYTMALRRGVPGSSVSLLLSTIRGNRSTAVGGGLSVMPVLVEEGAAPGGVGFDRVFVDNNRSTTHGGGVAVGVGRFQAYKGELFRNSAGGAGGALAFLTAWPSTVSMDTTQVQYNSATGDGGGIYLARNSQLSDGSGATHPAAYAPISGNQAGGNGGGVSGGPGATVELERAAVSDNSAVGNGGGIFLGRGSRLAADLSEIFGNKAARDGGGVSLGKSSELLLDAAYVRDNTATNGAGLDTAGDSLAVNRSTLAGNKATASGGGARVSSANAQFINSTFSGNAAATGGGVAFTAATKASFTHVTMADDQATVGAHLAAVPAARIAIDRSAVVLPITGTSCAGIGGAFTGTSGGFSVFRDRSCGVALSDLVTAADPQLAPLGVDLVVRVPAATSPLGGRVPVANCTLDEDQRWQPRPQGANCDAGSVEIEEAPPAADPTKALTAPKG